MVKNYRNNDRPFTNRLIETHLNCTCKWYKVEETEITKISFFFDFSLQNFATSCSDSREIEKKYYFFNIKLGLDEWEF